MREGGRERETEKRGQQMNRTIEREREPYGKGSGHKTQTDGSSINGSFC